MVTIEEHGERGDARELPGLRFPDPQENFAGGAKTEHFATATVRLARVTTAAPVPDEPVAPVCPMLAWHELHEIQLDLHRILMFR